MSELQKQASDPYKSVWVSASAGTGKTKIFTDRVLRLLISGAQFSEILCITYTKVASSEMQLRIMKRLEYFANISTEKLKNELSLLVDHEVTNEEIDRAKSLYMQILSSKNNINAYTIHALCEKIVRSFSFELGINPAFEVIEDLQTAIVLSEIKKDIFCSGENIQITDFFLSNFHESILDNIIKDIIAQKNKFLNLFITKTEFTKLSHSHKDALSEAYNRLIEKLLSFSLSVSRTDLKKIFFTDCGSKRKNISNMKPGAIEEELYYALTNNSSLKSVLFEFQNEIALLEESKNIEEIRNYSNLICSLAKIFLDKYEKYKKENSLVDFDDLILMTKSLLNDHNMENWILCKLDHNICHLLVDEAQDTNPDQWSIANSIIQLFYHHDRMHNSIFVVGDPKQSIFSFQGADLEYFYLMNDRLRDSSLERDKEFKNITLEYCYRSGAAILDVVYRVFNDIKTRDASLFAAENPKILPFRNSHAIVELWPLIKKESEKEDISNIATLARKIAIFIKDQIDSGRIMPATKLPAHECDFMILVRKRDEFAFELINQLKSCNLSVDSMDRISLHDSLAARDLISIAKFALLPNDDLNLASMLKSPIIGISDPELYDISRQRNKLSIWEYLNDINHHSLDILNKLILVHKTTSLSNFFTIILDYFSLREILETNENKEVIAELVAKSIDYARTMENCLQSFIWYFENNEITVKKSLGLSDKIRIMTIHGSKGLQAPIVIIADNSLVPTNMDLFIWHEEELYASRKDSKNSPFFCNLKEQQKQKMLQEYIRLLYVAMTRAEDHLIICGYSSKKLPDDNCWYNLIYNSMANYAKNDEFGNLIYELGADQIEFVTIRDERLRVGDLRQVQNSKWIISEYILNKIINPNINNSAASPLFNFEHLNYALVFHKILEDGIKLQNLSLLNKHPLIATLPDKLQEKIHKNIDKLLGDQNFLELIAGEIKLELDIGINHEGNIKFARIDMLVIADESITIVDYKSDAHPAEEYRYLPSSYIDQLNLYRHIIQKLYPKHKIICKIFWLETANFMII